MTYEPVCGLQNYVQLMTVRAAFKPPYCSLRVTLLGEVQRDVILQQFP